MDWTSYDAVVLTAIAWGAGDLDGLVATIDYINHDVPPAEVIADSLSRLAGSQLVRIEAGPRFDLTDRGDAVVHRRPGGPIGQVVDVDSRLRDVPPRGGEWELPDGSWDEAVDAYLRPHS